MTIHVLDIARLGWAFLLFVVLSLTPMILIMGVALSGCKLTRYPVPSSPAGHPLGRVFHRRPSTDHPSLLAVWTVFWLVIGGLVASFTG